MPEQIKKKQKVEDKWYPDFGVGTIIEVLKTRIKVLFNNEPMIYDNAHANKFLKAKT